MFKEMNYRCPKCSSSKSHYHGTYHRKSDSKTIKRFKCYNCLHTFSQATFAECYQQNKRRVNSLVGKMLCSGVSQRRVALLLKLTRKTVQRKLIFLAKVAQTHHHEFVSTLSQDELSHIQLDDLITSEHTKLKPLSLSIAVSKTSRYILAAQLSQIPAFGHLASLSRKKYGRRKSTLRENLNSITQYLSQILPSEGQIDSDEHKLYPLVIKQYLSGWQHSQFKSLKATVAGQGELKSRGRDPLFSINHTLAMMRANINRLFRRTWNTTKNPQMLLKHLWIYIEFHNQILVGR